MNTLLTAIGKRAYKFAESEPCEVQASVNFVAENKLNREGIFTLRSACNAGFDSLVLTVDDAEVEIERTSEHWVWTFDGKQHTRDFCNTLTNAAKEKGLPLSEATRDHRVDLYEVVTEIVRSHFPQIAPVARGGGPRSGDTKPVVQAKLTAVQEAYVAQLRKIAELEGREITDEEIAEELDGIFATAKSQADAKKEAREAGKKSADEIPSRMEAEIAG